MGGSVELLDHEASLEELRGLEQENLPGGGIRSGHGRHSRRHHEHAVGDRQGASARQNLRP